MEPRQHCKSWLTRPRSALTGVPRVQTLVGSLARSAGFVAFRQTFVLGGQSDFHEATARAGLKPELSASRLSRLSGFTVWRNCDVSDLVGGRFSIAPPPCNAGDLSRGGEALAARQNHAAQSSAGD